MIYLYRSFNHLQMIYLFYRFNMPQLTDQAEPRCLFASSGGKEIKCPKKRKKPLVGVILLEAEPKGWIIRMGLGCRQHRAETRRFWAILVASIWRLGDERFHFFPHTLHVHVYIDLDLRWPPINEHNPDNFLSPILQPCHLGGTLCIPLNNH